MSTETESTGGMRFPKHRFSKKQEFCMRVGAIRRALRREQEKKHREGEGLKALKKYMGD